MITLKDALSNPENIPEESWLCLPPDASSWTLSSVAALTLDSSEFEPDSEEYLPREVREDGWVEVLDRNIVEEVIFNANEYEGERTPEELLQAFIFYYENDAFMEFEE